MKGNRTIKTINAAGSLPAAFFIRCSIFICMPLYKYEISQVEKKEGVCRVKEIEKIFQARAFFAVVTQHQREGEQHHPLGNRAAVDHFAAKLADAEQNVYHGQQLGFFPQKIQGDAQGNKSRSIFVQRQIRDDPCQQIAVQLSGEREDVGEQEIKDLCGGDDTQQKKSRVYDCAGTLRWC